MERKAFLKNSIAALGLPFVAPLLKACSKETITPVDSATTTDDTCIVSPEETAGPFPTKTPSSLVTSNIVSDRSGVPLTVKISIDNHNNNCSALAGAIVDIWHCDAAGNYSEYGASGMQVSDYTGSSYHFLRGRQITDANGLVTFTSIFPGWYSGRAPHIHVHVYNANGTSLKITQIAIPTDTCDTVYTTATDYKSRGKQDTQNANDNVFSDSLANELATVTGSVAEGYILAHIITVSA